MEVNNELRGLMRWKTSALEIRKPRVVVICGMMGALAIVLGMVATIELGPYLRIGFSGLPNQAVAYMFGPVIGGIFGGMLDILKYLVKPTGAFFPGFTLTAIAGGVFYGAILYKREATLIRVLMAQVLVKVVCNIIMNTVSLNILYGKGFLALLPSRIISNAVMLPIDTAIMFFMCKMIHRFWVRIQSSDEAVNEASDNAAYDDDTPNDTEY